MQIEDHDRGLAFDMEMLINRRRALTFLGSASATAVLAGCGATAVQSGASPSSSSSSTSPTSTTGAPSTTTTAAPSFTTTSSARATTTAAPASTTTTTTAAQSTSCTTIPQETAGPYPGDGSNGPNVLTQSGIVRSDIRSSFGSSSGTASGVPMQIKLRVLSVAKGCAPLAGAAVYVWHADSQGRYSMYSNGVTNQNYLRGVQETDSNGDVTFASIFPSAYDGRWPHVHFEIYPSLSAATSAGSKLRTSQLALPKDVCDQVYATSGYSGSAQNLARTSLSTDMVFSDGYSLQLANVTGSVTSGYTTSLTVPV